jgi:hypothetical protein
MPFEQIEQLRQQYTDQYVMVDESRPELRRFRGATGRIKTVNMSGRALVQFDLYNDAAWHDISVEFLRIVDAPPPKVEEPKERKSAAKAAAKPAAEKAADEKPAAPAAEAPKTETP